MGLLHRGTLVAATAAPLVRLAMLGVLAVLLVACSGDDDNNSSGPTTDLVMDQPGSLAGNGPSDQRLVARVNQRAITEPQLDAFLEFRRQPLDQPKVRQAALADLVDMLLLVDESQTRGLLSTQAKAALTVQEWSFVANLALSDMARNQPISDQDIQEEYQRQVGLTGGTEYKLQHILVPSQLEAVQLVTRLADGEPFAVLLAELGGSDANGGDLGWVNLVQVPEGFSPVLKSLQPGEFSPVPISSDYGWHVLLVEDQRSFEPPPLAQIEEGIRNSLSRQRLERHMRNLRQAALIDRSPGG